MEKDHRNPPPSLRSKRQIPKRRFWNLKLDRKVLTDFLSKQRDVFEIGTRRTRQTGLSLWVGRANCATLIPSNMGRNPCFNACPIGASSWILKSLSIGNFYFQAQDPQNLPIYPFECLLPCINIHPLLTYQAIPHCFVDLSSLRFSPSSCTKNPTPMFRRIATSFCLLARHTKGLHSLLGCQLVPRLGCRMEMYPSWLST